MDPELQILCLTAVSIAFLHTISGPDHYIPFIALARSRGWTFGRTLFWTIVCGCGHVWSSVLLGLGGAALGWSVAKISWLENVRGGIAGWLMFCFGLAYFIYGLIRAGQNRSHKHFDTYDNGDIYVFEHNHNDVIPVRKRHKVTPWVMFLIFLLGPCEPMIPLLYFPAAKSSWDGMLTLIGVYTTVTLITMSSMVVMGYYGISAFKTEKLERYMHAIGGFAILVCGSGMVFMEW